jgi:hypothetical protein
VKYHWCTGRDPLDLDFEWLWCEHCSRKLHITDHRICGPSEDFCSIRCAVLWAGRIFHILTLTRAAMGKYNVRPRIVGRIHDN